MKQKRKQVRQRKRKCRNCGELYTPDYRNRRHQKFCSKPECKYASKNARQKKWRESSKGREYFWGEANVLRVQEWRKDHPGYWKRNDRKGQNALQDDCSSQDVDSQLDMHSLTSVALQDVCSAQPALIVGLIASLTGSALQDDIVKSSRQFLHLGQDILGTVPGNNPNGGRNDGKTNYMPATAPEGAQTVQLGGSPPGTRRAYHGAQS